MLSVGLGHALDLLLQAADHVAALVLVRQDGEQDLQIMESSDSNQLTQVEDYPASMKYRVGQKNLAKFSDACSVRANGLCTGSPRYEVIK